MSSVNLQAQSNYNWALTILILLKQHGVKHICFAPGSRSTPLVLAANYLTTIDHDMVNKDLIKKDCFEKESIENGIIDKERDKNIIDINSKNSMTLHHHFDERGLGFFALGIAKASQEPVAIIVTSGTAVANLLPAVVEANLTDEQLILLTADRPSELIDCGANQAIQQKGIFSTHVREALYLPSPSSDIDSLNDLISSVLNLLSIQKADHGPVHLNCPYPEPFYGTLDFSPPDVKRIIDAHLSSKNSFEDSPYQLTAIQEQSWLALKNKKGIIVAGQLQEGELSELKQLSQILHWPLLVDPQSGGHSDWFYSDLWLNHPKLLKSFSDAEVLLQFGARLVSKQLLLFIENQVNYKKWQSYWLIAPTHRRLTPEHFSSEHLVCNVKAFMATLASKKEFLEPSNSDTLDWYDTLYKDVQNLQDKIMEWLPDIDLDKERSTDLMTPLSFVDEVDLINYLNQNIKNQDRPNQETADLFLGNSLIVRIVDMLGNQPSGAVYTNRGASGIDGLLATAIGVQQIRLKPMVCLLGDLSLLYDLNSLALCKKVKQPMVVIVCNNDGGAIFDMLPIPDHLKTDLYRLPHGLEFSHVAEMFGINYHNVRALEQLNDSYQKALNTQGVSLIEISIVPQQASLKIQRLIKLIKAYE